MAKSQRHYLSYMLRLWRTSDGKKHVWQASLESPGTGERYGFASLKTLFSFLQALVDSDDDQIHDHDVRGMEERGDATTKRRET
ncbi:MAG: hypothetical protein SWK90_10335 [Chloroflexota bacterium]|nr:hypothetical protein [Chloroflexota bacterium]